MSCMIKKKITTANKTSRLAAAAARATSNAREHKECPEEIYAGVGVARP